LEEKYMGINSKISRFSIWPSYALSIAIIILLISSSCVSARVISSERIEVLMDHYQTLELQGKKDGILEIDVKVIEGDAVDVFLMNETNFYNYMGDRDYDYYEDGSEMNIKQKKWTFTAEEDGIYYIVLDNTDKGIAYPTSDLDVKIVVSDVTSTPFAGATETIIAATIVGLLIIIMGKKNGKKRVPEE
jgi:hypothetical protein